MSNAININLFRPIILSPKCCPKKKGGERSFIFQRKAMLCIGYSRVHFTHMSTDLYLTNTRKQRKLNVRAIQDLSKRPTCGYRYAINLPRPKFDQHLLPCLPIPSTVSLSPIPSYHNCKQSPLKLKPLSFHPPRITLKLILGRTRETKPRSLHPLVSITTCSLANHPLFSHVWVSKDLPPVKELQIGELIMRDFSFWYQKRNTLLLGLLLWLPTQKHIILDNCSPQFVII